MLAELEELLLETKDEILHIVDLDSFPLDALEVVALCGKVLPVTERDDYSTAPECPTCHYLASLWEIR